MLPPPIDRSKSTAVEAAGRVKPSAAVTAYAAASGALCHASFAAAVLAMIFVMLSGMTLSRGACQRRGASSPMRDC